MAEDEGLHISFAGEAFDTETKILGELSGYTLELTVDQPDGKGGLRTFDIVLDDDPVDETDGVISLRWRHFDEDTGTSADEPVRLCAYDIVRKLRVY